MVEPLKEPEQLEKIIRQILTVQEEDITCDECYSEIDAYVDMLRAGQDAAAILPTVRAHLAQCRCCDAEFRALIAILESAADSPE